MGIKKFKERFNIKHQVHIVGGIKACIGSPYVSELVSFDLKTGKCSERSGMFDRSFLAEYYPEVLEASPEEIVQILKEPDELGETFSVYTVDEETGELIEHRCEAYGWPNTTTDGVLMYDNEFFKTKEEALRYGLKSLTLYLKYLEDGLEKVLNDIPVQTAKITRVLGAKELIEKKLEELQ